MTQRNESRPILCYVTDRGALGKPESLLERIALAAAAGVNWVQIREKDMPARDLLITTQEAVETAVKHSAPGSRTLILVNDRLDVALAGGADGIHLPESSLPVAAVNDWRRVAGAANELVVGASCHSVAAARAAERDGADYIFFGPIFATPSKATFGAPQGINRLAEVSGTVRIPVLAIGGITAQNARECMAAGAAGIAAIRMFQESDDLEALVSRLRGGP